MSKVIALLGLILVAGNVVSAIGDAEEATDEEIPALGDVGAESEQFLADLALEELAPELVDNDARALDEDQDSSALEVTKQKWWRKVASAIGIGRKKKNRSLSDEEISAWSSVDDTATDKREGLTEAQQAVLAQAKCVRKNLWRCYLTRKEVSVCINLACKI